jgi:uncharacterized membrane protein
MEIIEVAAESDGSEWLSEDEHQAKSDLVVLLMGHLEFAPNIKDAVRACGEAGFTLRQTYVQVARMVAELRSARKWNGVTRVIGGMAAGAVSGVLAGLSFGGPAGAAVGAIVGIGAHFTPWGVFELFRQVDQNAAAGWQDLFANFGR